MKWLLLAIVLMISGSETREYIIEDEPAACFLYEYIPGWCDTDRFMA